MDGKLVSVTNVRVATLKETLRYGRAGHGRRSLPSIAGGAGVVVTREGQGATGTGVSASWNALASIPIGDLVVGCGGEFNNGHVPVFTDSVSNTYSSAVNGVSGSNGWGIARSSVGAAMTTASTFTVTGASTASFLGAYTLDVAGVHDAPYGSSTQASASTTTPSLSTSAPVVAGDLVVAYSFCNNAAYNTTVAGFTVYGAGNGSINDICAWTIAASAGVITFSPTTPTAQTHLMAVVVIPAGPPPAPVQSNLKASMKARR